jgi:O-antigen/teichoic acid export membrane protein
MGSYFATSYLVFLKKTYILVGLTIFSSILSLILNLILVPKFSIIGCIISGITSYIVYLFLILFVTHKVKKGIGQGYSLISLQPTK